MCDSLCVIGPDGLLFAKNSDRPPTEPQVFESHEPRRGGGTVATQYLELPDLGAFSFVGSRPTWLWGVEHGLNEHGVAIGNERLYTTGRPKARPRALLGMDLVRLGLERARTAAAAVDVITSLVESHGQGGTGDPETFDPYDSSFLIADAREGWIVETCDRTWAARSVGAGAAVSNRVGLSTDWTRASADVVAGSTFQDFRHPKVPTSIADHRLAATTACVARGASALTPALLAAAMRDHGSGPWGVPGVTGSSIAPPSEVGPDHEGVTVCMHVVGHQATTASMICSVGEDPDSRRAWVALGSPCVSTYVPIHPRDGVPSALSDVATWSVNAARRDAVDADPGALARIRAELDPIEARLWDASS